MKIASLLTILSLVLLSQLALASPTKKPKKIDLGLVRKSDSTEVEFKPETDPNKRSIAQERYTELDRLEWRNQAMLDQQQGVSQSHGQFQQQQVVNQALQNLPRISVPTFR